MMTAETAERHIKGLMYVRGKMIQQSHAPMDIEEVEGEVEGSDDQIDELRGASSPPLFFVLRSSVAARTWQSCCQCDQGALASAM